MKPFKSYKLKNKDHKEGNFLYEFDYILILL